MLPFGVVDEIPPLVARIVYQSFVVIVVFVAQLVNIDFPVCKYVACMVVVGLHSLVYVFELNLWQPACQLVCYVG